MYHAESTRYRRQLFAQCGRQIKKNLPRTQDSLKQHVLIAVYQAAFVWSQSLMPMQNRPSPD